MTNSAPEGPLAWSQYIEMVARGAALLLATAYVAGFLIVTIHHARLGIWQFDILRPRVLAAGTTFLILVLLAAATTFGAHRLLGIGGVGLPRSSNEHAAAATIVTAICATTTAYGFALWLRPILSSGETWKFWAPWQPIPFMLLVGSIDLFARARIARAPGTFVSSSIVGATALAGVVWSHASRFTSMLALWFWAVSLLLLIIYAVGRYRDALLRNQRLESLLVVAVVGVIYLYAVQIYGGINPWLGGGAPMRATFFFLNPVAGQAQSMDGRLIEETSHGYYLLPSNDPTRPLFVPRDGVIAIRFVQQ